MDKAPGAVCCAHCGDVGAQRVCPGCKSLICVACQGDGGCTPRQLRLGIGYRLRAVDPQGQTGLVAAAWGRPRLVSLSSGEVLATGVGLGDWTRQDPRDRWPWLVAPGCLMWPDQVTAPGKLCLAQRDVAHAEDYLRLRFEGPGSGRVCWVEAVSDGGRYAVLKRRDERLELLDMDHGQRTGTVSERGQVLHSVALCEALDLLAVGTFGKALFYRLSDLSRLGGRSLGQGELDWVGLAQDRAVMISDDGLLEVTRVDPRSAPRRWERLHLIDLEQELEPLADLDPGAELLALRVGRKRVAVLELSTGRLSELPPLHTDSVVLVRFVDDGQRLITADDDNRVVIWPRRTLARA